MEFKVAHYRKARVTKTTACGQAEVQTLAPCCFRKLQASDHGGFLGKWWQHRLPD
jgi:hypothetical protein